MEFLPLDGKEVWIRRLPWYDKPTLAIFRENDFDFVYTVLMVPEAGNYDRHIPHINVHTWKFRYLADEEEAFPPTP